MDASANGLGEMGEEIGKRGCEFITADQSTVVAKFVFDAIVVKDSEGDGCFSNPPCANEGNWLKPFCQGNYLLYERVAPEKGLRDRGR